MEAMMVNKFTGRVALITGGSGGIGRVVSLRLARDGFAVALNYAGNSQKAEEVAGEIRSTDGQALVLQADVSNEADVDRLFKQTVEAFGGLGVVVRSAGVMPLMAIGEGDVAVFERMMGTDLRGAGMVWRAA